MSAIVAVLHRTTTDDAIEAAAKAMYEANAEFHARLNAIRGREVELPPRPWDEANGYHRDLYRVRVRAVLPHLTFTPPVNATLEKMITDALDFEDYLTGDGPIADLNRIVEQRDDAWHRISVLLCDLTGGKLSKDNYDARTMVREVEAYFEEAAQEEIREATSDLRAECDAAVEDRDQFQEAWRSERLLKVDALVEAADARSERDAARAALDRVRELAERWRYKGEFGWGHWQEGDGPDPEGQMLDLAAVELRSAIDGSTEPDGTVSGGA